jgi:hypothetical protein
MEAVSHLANENEGQLKFDEFSSILEQLDSSADIPFEGPDPKVVEFLRILEGKLYDQLRRSKEYCIVWWVWVD